MTVHLVPNPTPLEIKEPKKKSIKSKIQNERSHPRAGKSFNGVREAKSELGTAAARQSDSSSSSPPTPSSTPSPWE